MAGSDPKANRALGQTSDRDNIDAEEDPLVELARIVSEDGGFRHTETEKPKTTRSEPIRAETLSRTASRRSCCRSSKRRSLRRESRRPAPRAPAPRSRRRARSSGLSAHRAAARLRSAGSQSEDERDPDDLLRSIEEQLSQFERRQAGASLGHRHPDPSPSEARPAAAEPSLPWNQFPVEEAPEPLPFGAPLNNAAEAEWRTVAGPARFTRSDRSRIAPRRWTSWPAAAAEPDSTSRLSRACRRRGPIIAFAVPPYADWDRTPPQQERGPVCNGTTMVGARRSRSRFSTTALRLHQPSEFRCRAAGAPSA